MAAAGAPGAKKLLHSSKLMQMKFMQRGVQRKQMQEQTEKQLDAEEEAHWVAPAGVGGHGCTVLMEADPPPGTAIGHMSFKAFNPAIEKLHEDREEMLLAAAKRKREATNGEGTSVSDAEMAQRLGAQSGAAGAPAGQHMGAAQHSGDGSRADLPDKGSKRSKIEGKAAAAAVETQSAAFAVPPVMPAATKAGSMRRPKKRERSGD